MKRRAARAAALACLLGVAALALVLPADQQAPAQPGAPASAYTDRTTGDGRSGQTGRTGAPAGGDVAVPAEGSGAGGAAQTVLAGFDAALARRPEDPAPLAQLAEEALARDPAAGLGAYARLADAYAEDASVQALFAAALFRSGDTGRATAAIERSLRLDPASAGSRLLYGRILAASTPPRTAAAVAEWKVAVELGSGTPAAREARELLLLHEGR